MKENWNDIPGYEGIYQASNLGRIKSASRTRPCSGVVMSIKERVMMQNTSNIGYKMITLSKNSVKKSFMVHRLVMASFFGKSNLHVDHIDGNKTNNNISNLRYCSHRENHSFDNVKKKRSSKYVGVSWNTKKGKWTAQISINNKNKYLGSFLTEKDAADAYKNKLSNHYSTLRG
jgi:hypothetical protein